MATKNEKSNMPVPSKRPVPVEPDAKAKAVEAHRRRALERWENEGGTVAANGRTPPKSSDR